MKKKKKRGGKKIVDLNPPLVSWCLQFKSSKYGPQCIRITFHFKKKKKNEDDSLFSALKSVKGLGRT